MPSVSATIRSDLDPECVPKPVREVLSALVGAGHRAVLVGGCVRDLLRGEEVRDFDAATDASPERVLALFPHAVAIGVRHGTVMVPTAGGPLDVTQLRAGPRLEDDLAHRDFTVNAIAWDPLRGTWLDPFQGRADLADGRLRAVRSADGRMREDPLRALRAARLVATLHLTPDADLRPAMRASVEALRRVPRERVRAELSVLLLGTHAGAGLALLRQTGIESDLAPGIADDAPEVVDALPRRLELRLAGWLRGGRSVSILRRLRFGRRRSEQVERLLRLHPIESGADPARDASLRRLLRRAGPLLEDALALRRAEVQAGSADPAVAVRLEALERGIERVRRQGHLVLQRLDLALDGRAVMERLGCGPGPAIGRALAHLTDRVVEDPSQNTPERLGEILDAWWAEQDRGRGSGQA
jgi:tRNA nucleotidyltransferase (CCA-adding enzyme)